MTNFEIIHSVNGRLQAVTLQADNAGHAQELFIDHYEQRGWVVGEIVLIEGDD